MSEVRSAPAPVLLYDGICGVCNSAVQTILRLDRRGTLRFAALGGGFAEGVLARHPVLHGVDSLVFVDDPGGPDEHVTVKSAAALRGADYLGGPWRALLPAWPLAARPDPSAFDAEMIQDKHICIG